MEVIPMKTFSIIVKVVLALAAIAGVVYVVATYGDKIVAWAKKMLGRCRSDCDECDCEGCDECCSDCEGCDEDADEIEVQENDFE